VSAYVVVETVVTDPERAARYRPLSGASVQRHGGRFLARGGAISVLEGSWDPKRVVVIEFPSVEKAREWYESEDYAVARKVREGAGEWRIVLVQGVAPGR
jgi:uncharacterized protein (DUF1330 family)